MGLEEQLITIEREMENNVYQFVTLVYNHEKLIEDHLNSILVQIINFGENKLVKLTLIDDASKDNSVDVIKKWINKNKNLFFEIDLIENKLNLGIKKNYIKSIQYITTSRYKLLGGDDVYLQFSNVFDFMDYAHNKSVVFSPMYINGNFPYSQKLYIHRISYFKNKKIILGQLLKKMNQFSAPGAFISFDIVSSLEYIKYLNYSEENFEDWPSWRYCFVENDYDFEIFRDPIVDYRSSSSRINTIQKNKFSGKFISLFNRTVNSLKIRVFNKYGFHVVISDISAVVRLIFSK